MALYCLKCGLELVEAPCARCVSRDGCDSLHPVSLAASPCVSCGFFTLSTGEFCEHCGEALCLVYDPPRHTLGLSISKSRDGVGTHEVDLLLNHGRMNFVGDLQVLVSAGLTSEFVVDQLSALAQCITDAVRNERAGTEGCPQQRQIVDWFSVDVEAH